MLVSAPEDADLMNPASWTATPPLPFDTAWLEDVQPSLPSGGYLEGQHHSAVLKHTLLASSFLQLIVETSAGTS